MKIVVTGGRHYADREFVFSTLDDIHADTPITLLIHGACGWDADKPWECVPTRLQGADGLADAWTVSRGVPVERMPSSWTSLGRAGGPIRNGLMLDRKPDLVVAFPGNTGTQNCVTQAFNRSIPIQHAARDKCEALTALQRHLSEATGDRALPTRRSAR